MAAIGWLVYRLARACGPAELSLGHVNCLGHTLDWCGRPSLSFTVEALWPDGSTSAPQATPLTVTGP